MSFEATVLRSGNTAAGIEVPAAVAAGGLRLCRG